MLFYMYRPDRFVEEADRRNLAGEGVSPEVIDEIHQLENFEQSGRVRKSQLNLLRALAVEAWGELGVGILEENIGKKLDELSRREANELIDSLTPDETFGPLTRSPAEVSRKIGYGALQSKGVPLGRYVELLLDDLESTQFSLQNKAVAALKAAGPQELADLDQMTQEQLGRMVVAAAHGTSYSGSFEAQRFIEQLRSERKVNRQWPEAFIRGILLEALLGEDLRFYPKMKYLSSVVKTALDHEGSAQILADVTNAIEGSEPLSDKTNRYDEVIEILENVQVTQDANGRPINSLIEAIEFVRNAGTAH